MIHPAMGLGINELSSAVGLMEEPETKMTTMLEPRAKPKPRAKPGIKQRRDLEMGLCEAHTLYNLAIGEVKIISWGYQ